MASSLRSEIVFGSYLVYSPRGQSDDSKRSRRIRDEIKRGTPTVARAVNHLRANFGSTELHQVLGHDVTLVPCPRSSPLVEGGFWPAKIIAEVLAGAGFGRQVLPLLERMHAVPKSAFQKFGERPDAQRQYETMRARPDLAAGGRITIVDDFLTKGNTLLGAASRLAEVYPQTSITVFALVRTMGLQPEVDRLDQPCVGRIRNFDGNAVREP